ncbi:MAG: ABC transporter permease subunit [Candidatus Hodarchaeales archaeon]|jgi:ABC-2 type transport system permease protein
MKVFLDSIKQEKGLVLAFLFFSTIFIALIIMIYPGDTAAVEQITGLEDMGDWEAIYGIVYGEGGEYRFWLAFFLFSYIGILYTAIPALVGTNVFSKDNDDNTIDLLLSNPITRRKILLEKFLAVITMCFGSILYLFLLVYLLSLVIGQNISVELLSASCIQLFTLLVFISLLSVLFAVLFLDSGRAKRYIGFIIVGSFIIGLFVLFSAELEFLKYFQVFYYYDSASTILKPSLEQVVWDKALYLIIFSIFIFGIIFVINDRKDLIPHFSHKVQEKKSKEKGIPLLFFFVGRLQHRFPSFVEQIQSDKVIVYLFALLMTISGLVTPSMYPGDEAWVGLSKTYSSIDILMSAILRNHGVANSFIGYIATEGFGEYFLYSGIISMFLGSKIIIRDQKSNTLDLLFAHSKPTSKILKERLAAITLEIFIVFLLNYFGYIIGIILYGNGFNYIPILGIGIFLTFLIVITITFLIVLLSIFIKTPGKAVAISGMTYFGILLVFMLTYTIDQIKFLSTLTPFYWIDRIRILYEETILLEDIVIISLYLSLMCIMYVICIKRINGREYF